MKKTLKLTHIVLSISVVINIILLEIMYTYATEENLNNAGEIVIPEWLSASYSISLMEVLLCIMAFLAGILAIVVKKIGAAGEKLDSEDSMPLTSFFVALVAVIVFTVYYSLR